MTPKEKAKELVDNMYAEGINGWESMSYHEAIGCAKVAVEEILSQDKNAFDITEREYHFEYWYNVKQEIQKL